MLKSLNIDLYLNGYNFEQTNCVDLPIAASAGYYNVSNYFYYCLYYALYKNWNISKYNENGRNEILNKLGLEMKPYKIENTADLIPFIKESIDSNIPLLFFANYSSLFYYTFYKEESGRHAIIISGYDAERSIVLIRDSKVVDRMHNPKIDALIKSDPFYKLQLTEDMFTNIWVESSKLYIQENHQINDTIFRIEKISNPRILNYDEIIEEFIFKFNPDTSNMISFVEDFNKLRRKFNDNSIPFWIFRRKFHHTTTIIFDILEKFYQGDTNCIDKYDDYYKFKDEFIRFRSALLSKLHKLSLKEIDLDEYEKNRIINNIINMDKKLVSIIHELYVNSKNNGNYTSNADSSKEKLVNYALNSVISADSEDNEFLSNTNLSVISPASTVTSGIWENWPTDGWSSSDEAETHWLKVDLGKSRSIRRFVIRHRGRKTSNTRDFKIQGSNDNVGLRDLVKVENNDKNVTIHEVDYAEFRYFRLYITDACIDDYRARIFEFEVWGI